MRPSDPTDAAPSSSPLSPFVIQCDNCDDSSDGNNQYRYMSTYPVLTMKYGAPPGMQWKDGAYEYDIRSYSSSGDQQITLRQDSNKYR